MHSTTPSDPTPSPPRIHISSRGYEALVHFEKEVAAYIRELPRWLQEGHAGHYTVINGDDVLGVWEKYDDALEFARDRFGIDAIFVKKLDPRDPDRFAQLFVQLKAEGRPCP